MKTQLASRLESWVVVRQEMSALMSGTASEGDSHVVERIETVCEQLRKLRAEDKDTALYALLYGAAHDLSGYSASHALTCAVVSEIAAVHLDAGEDEVRSLMQAALTMNLDIASLQDVLAEQILPTSDDQRAAIDGHGRRAAQRLAAAGASDPMWLHLVEHHHEASPVTVDLANRTGLLTELLRRVDIYTAKLSRRATRVPTSPLRAAREACLDATGQPDAIGAAILRAIGLYPPGTWVLLANDELALVTRTGQKAHSPIVAALQRKDGTALYEPILRDTSKRQYQVRSSIDAREVRVRVDHVLTLDVAAGL